MTSDKSKWKRTDSDIVLQNCPEHIEIGVFYLRIYTAHAGFQHSNDNDLVQNFKRPITYPENVLQHKKRAILQFTEDLKRLFLSSTLAPQIFLTPIPTSKSPDDAEYDDRLHQVAKSVANIIPNIIYFPVLTRTSTIPAQHLTPGERTIEKAAQYIDIEESLRNEFVENVPLLLLDDVLHSGATFSACRNKLVETFSTKKVPGIFWALSKNSNPADLLDELK